MLYLKKRFRFEYSSGNNDVYRRNWERIFGGKEQESETAHLRRKPLLEEEETCTNDSAGASGMA